MRAVASSLVALATLFAVAPARAGSGDGAYGRLDGDVTLAFGAGAAVANGSRGLATFDARARYLDAAGVSLSYENAFAGEGGVGRLRHALLAGIELRPLFPARFFKGQESGNAFFDLVLDSLSLDVGTWWSAREGVGTKRPGAYVGGAVEIPVGTSANGLFVRLSGSYRWSAERLEGFDDPGGAITALGVGLAWHQVVGPSFVQRGDEPLR